jgi:hypothetical protein
LIVDGPMQDPQPYNALREQIDGLLTEGRLHTRKAGEWEKVETYWHIGDALQRHISARHRGDYGERVVENISRDLNLSASLVWDILRFRRSLATLPTCCPARRSAASTCKPHGVRGGRFAN